MPEEKRDEMTLRLWAAEEKAEAARARGDGMAAARWDEMAQRLEKALRLDATRKPRGDE